MRCYRCDRPLEPGEHAYVQEVKVVKIVGTKARTTITEVIVCIYCAK